MTTLKKVVVTLTALVAVPILLLTIAVTQEIIGNLVFNGGATHRFQYAGAGNC